MSGKPEVEHDQVRLLAIDGLDRGAAVHRGEHLVAARAQQRRQRAEDVRLVVDDQDPRRHRQASLSTARVAPGTSIENRAPAPGAFSAHTRPPMAFSNPRAIASPMPVPGVACWAPRPR